MKKDKKNPEEAQENIKKPAKSKDVVSGYKMSALDEELERLAEMFREELKNQGEEEDDEEVLRDSQGIIYEDEVCECCGERRRAKNSEYCKVCQEAMRKYPLSLSMIIVAAVVVFFAVFSVFDFSYNFDGYYAVSRAKKAENKREMFSAIDFYEEAIQLFSLNGVNAKGLRFDSVDAMCEVMVGSEDILVMLSSAIEDYEAVLPIYNKRVAQYDEIYVLHKTMDMMFDIYEDEAYANASEDEEVYKKAMTAIGSLIDQEIVVPSLDGKSRTYKCNEAAVRFCQYSYAYLMGKSDDVYHYVHEVYELAPEYLCMYGYDLGIVSAQTREFKLALDVADALLKNNVEDSTSYCIYSIVERLRGNYDGAIEWADKGLSINPNDSELMRNKAMAYASKGDYKGAKTIIDKAKTYGDNDLCYAVSLVIESELGNTETVAELKEMYVNAKVDIPVRVQEYLDGKLTAVQVFTEGTGDV